MGSALSKLSPLSDHPLSQKTDQAQLLNELALAKNELRSAKASFSIVDLSSDVRLRDQLEEQRQKELMAGKRLEEATSSWLSKSSTSTVLVQ